ncbi:putative structural maintenance of chromosomes protein [Rosa chinensis]|uniref:Putative structural maintenance of chromosomes protein n=1 Tax=Rosa chinensis TaxID=74649 RepID=A0A2P6SM96_ROSCH|nr:structural maintenance of chromosomes protein 6A [Rosa chinensis]PRQ59796.1 putative structural maintenance of chromosomes protein [Rosa chinensis]
MAEPIAGSRHRSKAGIVQKIRLENFMCHSSLQIELGDWVNFITGQNGSGKSAILTALCVAFGSRAKETQRGSTLKDFIKTGCSYAVVHVELKNQGEDAFKPDIYGDVIIIERKISGASNATVLKDHQGRKVASRKEDLRELIEHFSIDVENPCVIMGQDRSREFLHSGNDKDKFKFFYKATLLQQVEELLQDIEKQLEKANVVVDQLEGSIRPIERELNELHEKIKNMEHIEEISQQAKQLKKKLAWSWVYDVDRQLQQKNAKIGKLKNRVPLCQAKIDQFRGEVEKLSQCYTLKKSEIASMVEKTAEVRRMKDELRQSLASATKEKLKLEEEYGRKTNYIQKLTNSVRSLQQQIQDAEEQHARNTQAEESAMEEKLKELHNEVATIESMLARLQEEDSALSISVHKTITEIGKLTEMIQSREKECQKCSNKVREVLRNQSNKVTAFGGDRVMDLLRIIERNHQRFKSPPIGPIGAHLTLNNGDEWARTVENAVGRLLNAFIVTNHKDSQLLRTCAREASYNHLQIIIYDFSLPRLNIPPHMLPQTRHPTTLSLLHSENHTVVNVLVDMGSVERQVLVKTYEEGKEVAFDQRIPNLKEVYTYDGRKMFSRGSVQTVLPPIRHDRPARLCANYDDQISELKTSASAVQKEAEECRTRKREEEDKLWNLKEKHQSVKRRRMNADRDLASKRLAIQDSAYDAEASTSPASTVDDLHQDILKVQEEIQEREMSLKTFEVRISEAVAKTNDLKVTFENLCESAKGDIDAFEKAERDLMEIETKLGSAQTEKLHYEGLMKTKVLHEINDAEKQYKELEHHREDNCRKASILCPESEITALGDWDGSTPEQLSAQLTRLNQRLQRESERCTESIDELRMSYERKERKILRKQKTYRAFREKLNACQKALKLRSTKFQRNKDLLKRQMTWRFNSHLGRKGFSGKIKVSYEERTLSIEVKMPQDSSSSTVRDTRGLSGGERSFSTLCFALALHDMTEAPFRAMDEFDVFMDAVSRKISLDTLVEFALAQGSQWVLITPHDISMVKNGDRIKKQQMAAPRS